MNKTSLIIVALSAFSCHASQEQNFNSFKNLTFENLKATISSVQSTISENTNEVEKLELSDDQNYNSNKNCVLNNINLKTKTQEDYVSLSNSINGSLRHSYAKNDLFENMNKENFIYKLDLANDSNVGFLDQEDDLEDIITDLKSTAKTKFCNE